MSTFKIQVLAFLMTASALAHEGGPEGANFGPDKGVTQVSEKDGFKLSPEAYQTFQLSIEPLIKKRDGYLVPQTALVHTASEVSLYRVRDSWIKRIDIRQLKKSSPHVLISAKDLAPNDRIIGKGANWVRVSELDGLGEEAEHGDKHGENTKDEHEEPAHD